MKYNVSINEKSRSITVTLADGTKGVARCCPTDKFDINTGIELALERAKVSAKAKAEKPTPMTANMTVTMLVRELEKALPKGQMVVVGNGKKLTDNQKKWLRSLAGGCSCKCHEVDEDEIYDRGYADGYADAMAEVEDEESETEELEEALEHIRDILADVGITI